QIVIMKGRPYRGYVYVDADSLKTKAALNYWIGLALEYNDTLAAKDRQG
ncbi:MAG: TfoX/Sxy family protein, partial [Thermoplasmatota archaeon]